MKNKFRHLDLFSGIGGFALATKLVFANDYETAGFCEIDKFCQSVLRKNFGEDISLFNDIYNLQRKDINGEIDLITAGFPCQKYSQAGSGIGSEPLKDEMLRIVQEFSPGFCLIENVGGFISDKHSHEHDSLCKYLENLGYETATFDIDASSVGHQTLERHIWIVAAHSRLRIQRSIEERFQNIQTKGASLSPYYCAKGIDERWLLSASKLCRVAERIPHRVDRLKSLGNAIPPYVAVEILQVIKTLIKG